MDDPSQATLRSAHALRMRFEGPNGSIERIAEAPVEALVLAGVYRARGYVLRGAIDGTGAVVARNVTELERLVAAAR